MLVYTSIYLYMYMCAYVRVCEMCADERLDVGVRACGCARVVWSGGMGWTMDGAERCVRV